jgi:hypothetical protein
MEEAQRSSETSVLTRATLRNLPEDIILHSHRRENIKSFILAYIFIYFQNNFCSQDWKFFFGLSYFCAVPILYLSKSHTQTACR